MKIKRPKIPQQLFESLTKIIVTIFSLVELSLPVTFNLQAGALTTLKDTLSNSRPSVSTAILSAITSGDTTINVTSSLGFVQGDTITLCTAACSSTENKVISSIISPTQLGLTVGTTNAYSSGNVYFKSSSKHTITFSTRSAVSGGKFIITLPGASTPNSNIPSASGFAFNNIATSDITLTGGTAGTIATSSPSSNVVITIPFTGTIAGSSSITITIGNAGNLLNPTKTAAQDTADISAVKVDETDGSSNIIDTTTVDVGTIESVGVSATVAPSLNFTINAVSSGTNITGYGTNAASTATTVPFGTLTINATSTIAQYLHVDTNSNSGYAVTVQQDGSLRKTNGTTIVDFDSGTTQNNEAATGFGYSLANKTGTDAAFVYTGSGTFNGRGFSSTTPFSIMSNSGPVNGSEIYVLYRVKVSATQAQGVYQNLVTYICTPIF